MRRGRRDESGGGWLSDDVRLFAWAATRARWRSSVGLIAVVGATVAGVVAALLGAGRSDTAFERLRLATDAADVTVYAEGGEGEPPTVGALRSLAGVERAVLFAELFVRPVGTEYFPIYDLRSVAPVGPVGDAGVVNQPVIVAGRAVDPGRPHEVAVSERLARELGVGVGDSVALESITQEWLDTENSGGEPGAFDGPVIDVEVVGLARSPADFGRWVGVLHLSPAFFERYGEQIAFRQGVEVRLADTTSPQAVLTGFGVERSGFAGDDGTDEALATAATALKLLAAAIAVTGGVFTAFLLARLCGLLLSEQAALVALGWTRRRLVVGVGTIVAPALVVGILMGSAVGVLVSPLTLFGLAGDVDPTPGSIVVDDNADTLVAVVVAAAFVVCGLIGAFVVYRAAAPREHRSVRSRPSGLWIGPPPVAIGIRHALFGDSSSGGRGSRGALAVMIVGVAAAAAAITLAASISRLQTDPSLSGLGAGRVIDAGESVDRYDRLLTVVEASNDLDTVVGVHVFDLADEDGTLLQALAYDVRRGDFVQSVVNGRAAQHPDEVALGPVTLRQLDREIGDRIRLRGSAGDVEFEIVGSVLFPEGDFDFDDGVAMSTEAADRVVGDVHDQAFVHQLVVEWADGIDTVAADRQLAADIGVTVITADARVQPATVRNLSNVRSLPLLLAGFVGVVSLIATGHSLAIASRARAREFATLRAIGMTRRSTSWVVGAQGFTVLGIALVIGIPTGFAIGRQSWTSIAQRAGVVPSPVASWAGLMSLLVIAIVSTAAITAAPAWRTRKIRPAATLRRGVDNAKPAEVRDHATATVCVADVWQSVIALALGRFVWTSPSSHELWGARDTWGSDRAEITASSVRRLIAGRQIVTGEDAVTGDVRRASLRLGMGPRRLLRHRIHRSTVPPARHRGLMSRAVYAARRPSVEQPRRQPSALRWYRSAPLRRRSTTFSR